MSIRKAVENDYDVIKSLISAFPESLHQTHLPGYQDFFVAEECGQVVGCCALEVFYKKSEPNPRLAEIRSLAVNRDFQRRGLGGELIQACVQRARSESVYEVFAFTDKPELFDRYGIRTCNGAKFAVFIVVGNGKE